MSLFFSRLSLNRDAPTQALSRLLNPEDYNARTDAHHQLIWTLFGDSKDRRRDFLWRADGQGRFYTLSARPPLANDLFNPPETKVFEPKLAAGDRLQFSLRVNATRDRAVVSRVSSAARRGKSRRVDVVMDMLREVPTEARAAARMRCAQTAAKAWIERQGAAKGFAPRSVVVEDYRVLELGRSSRRGLTHGVLDLAGDIEVTNPEVFLTALASGFGRAKAWGCGLMLIRRLR